MINLRKILILVSSFPATAVWFALYFQEWKSMIVCLVVASFIMIIAAYIEKAAVQRIREIAFILVFYIPFLLFAYAKLYQQAGLYLNSEIVYSLKSAIYFSIVTWTTLGYGDYQPTEGIRLWAASEALFGYIFMAILVGLSIGILVTEKRDT
jgi:hypothetical protein